MSKILITGGAGYIGSHANKVLNQQGYETVIVDNLVDGSIHAVKWGTFEQVDLLNPIELDQVFKKHKIDGVLHFAALANVPDSVIHPAEYYRTNVIGTTNLLDAMIKNGVYNLIFASTAAVYGIPETMPIQEDAHKSPITPYGKSKLMVEDIIQDYAHSYKLKYVGFRFFCAAGADPEFEVGECHRNESHLIPLALDTALNLREKINIYGTDYPTKDGTGVRDYIHVMDIVGAHILALKYLENGGASDVFNLGLEKGFSVREVLESVSTVTGKVLHVEEAPKRPGDPAILIASNTKAKQLLGWNPAYTEIDDIITHAWNWELRSKLPRLINLNEFGTTTEDQTGKVNKINVDTNLISAPKTIKYITNQTPVEQLTTSFVTIHAVKGSATVTVRTTEKESSFSVDKPEKLLHIGPKCTFKVLEIEEGSVICIMEA